MFSFFRPKSELGVIFDIGSSSVGAGLVRFDPAGTAHVIYTLREVIPYQEKLNPKRLFKDMISALERANARMLKEGVTHLRFTESGSQRIKHVVYSFSSPWSATRTKIVKISKEQPFELTPAMVARVVADEEDVFEKELGGELAVIEKHVIEISLNGYSVADPYAKKTKRADISFFMSLIPKAVLERVFEASVMTYHPKDTKAFSFPLVAFSMIRDIFHDKDDFIFLDIGGEVSDVSVIKNSLMLETASFPLGRNFLVRRVSKAFAMAPSEAESLLRLRFDGNASQTVEAKLRPVIDAAAKEWLDALHKTLFKLSTAVSLPQDLFVLIDSDFVHFFMKAIKEEKLNQFGVAEVPFTVTLLNADKLKGIVTFSPKTTRDSAIGAVAAFAVRKGGLDMR